VKEAVCWAHARRAFYDLYKANASPIAAEALERIGKLYEIESDIRGRPPPSHPSAISLSSEGGENLIPTDGDYWIPNGTTRASRASTRHPAGAGACVVLYPSSCGQTPLPAHWLSKDRCFANLAAPTAAHAVRVTCLTYH
jgi:Transposase IS66 family